MNFFKKLLSRKLIISTIVAPALVAYAQSHGWPDHVTLGLLGLLGINVAGQSAIDHANAKLGK